MAIPSEQQDHIHPCTTLDALYCQEHHSEFESESESESESDDKNSPSSLNPLMLLEQDLFWDDEELTTLFSKEKKQEYYYNNNNDNDYYYYCYNIIRKDSVEWIIRVNEYYGFSNLTAVLAVNYFDRFMLRCDYCELDKQPWMVQLLAVSCISLAAKVEEPFVPLLLDLQVEGTKYMFEAKNIQKMELLVLSTLEWKMNPVTSLSFLDHIIRRLGFNHPTHWEFYRRCENLLVSLLPDLGMVRYLPSELATATMLHVIDDIIEPSNSLDYQNQLLGVLNITKEKVNDCYKLIEEKRSRKGSSNINNSISTKRKYEELMNASTTTINEANNNMDIIPNDSPSLDMSNNASWANTTFSTNTTLPSSSLSVVSSSPAIRSEKKGRMMSSRTDTTSFSKTTTSSSLPLLAVSSLPSIKNEKKGEMMSSWTDATSFSANTKLSSSSLLSLSAVSSSPVIRSEKKVKMMPMPLKLASLGRVFVDVVASPH